LLHEGRIAGVASEHVDTKLSQKVIPPIGAHPYHKPMVDFLSPISLDPLKHIQNLVDFCFNKNLDQIKNFQQITYHCGTALLTI
jgi:hypothetical protein